MTSKEIDNLVVKCYNFPKLADHVLMYLGKIYCNPNDIKDGDSVYCDIQELYKFKDILMEHKDLKLITNRTDAAVADNSKINCAAGVINTNDFEGCFRIWFTKNCYSIKENVIPIPLGLDNKDIWHNHKNKGHILSYPDIKTNPFKTAYLACSAWTNPSKRHLCINECSKLPFIDIEKFKIPFNSFMDKMTNYKFIISPDGRGIDCHRHWEALFLNRIPVIKNEYPLKRLYKDMPVLFVKEWTDLANMNLDSIYNEMEGTLNPKYITQKYWNDLILKS